MLYQHRGSLVRHQHEFVLNDQMPSVSQITTLSAMFIFCHYFKRNNVRPKTISPHSFSLEKFVFLNNFIKIWRHMCARRVSWAHANFGACHFDVTAFLIKNAFRFSLDNLSFDRTDVRLIVVPTPTAFHTFPLMSYRPRPFAANSPTS